MINVWDGHCLTKLVQTHLEASPDFGQNFPIEIEDAVKLLLESDQYGSDDIPFWDEDGTNNIVDK